MKFVFLMDPLETVNYDKDTTFMLMLGSFRRGHEIYMVGKNGLSLHQGHVRFDALAVTPQAVREQPFVIQKKIKLMGDDVNAVFIRPDPPFDETYLMNTWILDHLPKKVAVVNNPTGIRTVNEKVWTAQFTDLVPATLISSNKDDLLHFISAHRQVIAKPTNGFGGQGVFIIQEKDSNAKVILETLTDRYQKPIILQDYVPQSTQGDKRILLLNGEYLGTLLRVHAEGEHRNNFFAGGKPQLTSLTDRDKTIIATLKPKLQALGLYFVGIDIIGDYLIEVNVTSPTCLQEINKLNQVNLENTVIEFVEALINQKSLS